MRNNAKDLVALVREAGTFLESWALPTAVVYKANLVIEEVLTNVVKYAFKDASVHEIGVFLAVEDADLLMRFVDDGQEFDPLSVPPPVMNTSLSETTEGGLGVYLVRKSVGSIEYRREQSNNVLTITISLRSE